MKINNFKLVEVIGADASNWKFKATIEVTNIFGLFKKETEVFKTYTGAWYFVDSGKYVFGPRIDELVKSLEAKKGKSLQHCMINSSLK